jgi:hypothetical protein
VDPASSLSGCGRRAAGRQHWRCCQQSGAFSHALQTGGTVHAMQASTPFANWRASEAREPFFLSFLCTVLVLLHWRLWLKVWGSGMIWRSKHSHRHRHRHRHCPLLRDHRPGQPPRTAMMRMIPHVALVSPQFSPNFTMQKEDSLSH